MPALSVKFYLESKTRGKLKKKGDSKKLLPISKGKSKIKYDSKKLLPIFLYIRDKGKTIKVFTERKCTAHAWDIENWRANPRKFRNSIELNGFLSDVEEESSNLYNYNSRKGIHNTKEQFKRLIQRLSGHQTEEQSLLKFLDSYIAKANYTESTKTTYNFTRNALELYSIEKRKRLDFNDIDLNFYDDFTSWLWKRGLNDNTVGKHIKHIKALMSQAFERDLHSNMHFRKKKFQVFKRPSDSIYLNEAELQKLLALDLSNNEILAKVRDTFIIASWTGLRFSDLARLTPDKFIIEDDLEILKIETEKTGEIVKIPISPIVKPILERYNFKIPVLSNQKMNEYLKDIGELAKIEQDVEISDMRAGIKSREIFKKYDLITTHTARRSFASNLYIQGIPARSIMAITGHRTEKAFMAYIKLSHMEKIRLIDTHFKIIHATKLKIA